jgi:Putative zinc-finger
MPKHPLTALVPYIRDELAPDERLRVALHVEECGECRELTASLAAISADLARWVEQMPAPDPSVYRVELARKLASRQTAKPRFWSPRFAWVSFAALSASAIALILMVSIHRQPSLPSVEQLSTENEISDAGIGLLRDYPVVSHLDLLENYDVIEHLNELPEADTQRGAAPAEADLDWCVLYGAGLVRSSSS